MSKSSGRQKLSQKWGEVVRKNDFSESKGSKDTSNASRKFKISRNTILRSEKEIQKFLDEPLAPSRSSSDESNPRTSDKENYPPGPPITPSSSQDMFQSDNSQVTISPPSFMFRDETALVPDSSFDVDGTEFNDNAEIDLPVDNSISKNQEDSRQELSTLENEVPDLTTESLESVPEFPNTSDASPPSAFNNNLNAPKESSKVPYKPRKEIREKQKEKIKNNNYDELTYENQKRRFINQMKTCLNKIDNVQASVGKDKSFLVIMENNVHLKTAQKSFTSKVSVIFPNLSKCTTITA